MWKRYLHTDRPTKLRTIRGLRLSVIVASAVLSACAGTAEYTDFNKDIAKKAEKTRKGPEYAPQLNATGFGPALRCMDFMFLTYGVRDLTMLVEDISEGSTKKVRASGKDMIISAVSQMTRRSRGIRLVAFSINDATLSAVMGLHSKAQALENPPDFAIRGSVSQFDENVVRKQGDAGIGIGVFSAGVARQAGGSILAVDLSIIGTETLELVPGAISKNSVLVMKQGSGVDGEVNTRKFGLNFSFTLTRSEGTAQALRTLSELAAIELLGKLTKIPYWTCLGATDDNQEVLTELTDWWETLAADPISLIAYLQQQMIARGLYPGDVTGEIDDTLLHAISIYQQAMGRKASTELDFDFFRAYLKTDHNKLQTVAQALLEKNPGPPLVAVAPPASPAKAPAAAAAAASNTAAVAAGPLPKAPAPVAAGGQLPFVYVAGAQGKDTVYRPGQAYKIDVAVDSDSYLYCYLIDENRAVNQFYPNPVQTEPGIKAGTRLQFPGNLPFTLVASPRGKQESIACFAATQPLGTEPLPQISSAANTDELTTAFRAVAGPAFGIGVYDVNVQ